MSLLSGTHAAGAIWHMLAVIMMFSSTSMSPGFYPSMPEATLQYSMCGLLHPFMPATMAAIPLAIIHSCHASFTLAAGSNLYLGELQSTHTSCTFVRSAPDPDPMHAPFTTVLMDEPQLGTQHWVQPCQAWWQTLQYWKAPPHSAMGFLSNCQ
jgi:hypothetical protein